MHHSHIAGRTARRIEAKPEEILANLVAIPEFLTNPFPQATILGLATIAVMYPTPVRISYTLSS